MATGQTLPSYLCTVRVEYGPERSSESLLIDNKRSRAWGKFNDWAIGQLQVLLSKRDSECGIVCEDTERRCAGLTAADSHLILVEFSGGDIADESF